MVLPVPIDKFLTTAAIFLITGCCNVLYAQIKPFVNIDSALHNSRQVHITQVTSVSQIDSMHVIICTGYVKNYVNNGALGDESYSARFDYDTVEYKIQLCKKYGDNWAIVDSGYLTSSDNYDLDGVSINIGDVDLDGDVDVMLLVDSDGRGNHKYHLYSVKMNIDKLIEIKGFELLSDPVFDEIKKVFHSTEKFHAEVKEEIYKIINGSLVLVNHK